MKSARLRSSFLVAGVLVLTLGPPLTSRAQPAPAKRTISINFDGVELPVFIKFISKVTGRNFVFSDKIGGSVTVISPTPVTRSEAEAVLYSVLSVRGFTTADDGVVIRIIPMKEAVATGSRLLTGAIPPSAYATRLIPLSHIDAAGLLPVFTPLLSKEGSLSAYTATNTLILSDTSSTITKIEAIVEQLDRPGHQQDIAVLPLDHASATVMADQLIAILKQSHQPKDKGKPVQPQLGEFKIVPDERTNSLVVTAGVVAMRRIRDLVSQLDTALDLGEQRIHVYHARHGDAEDIVGVVHRMLAGSRVRPAAGRGGAQKGTPPPVSGLTDTVSVTADPATNAIIVNSSAHDFKVLFQLLEDLDVARPQVFVEALIVEVSVSRAEALGFDFQVGGDLGNGVGIGRANLANLNSALLNPASLGGLILAAASDRSVRLPDGTEVPAQLALFQALATDSDINVLSAPTLLTLDNQEAQITVGQNVPFITGQGVDVANLSNVFTRVERKDVGIKLKLTPQVTEGDVVVLDVEQEVSALVESTQLDASNVGPTTNVRSASTTVSVKDGHTAVIGGLISDTANNRSTKVPFLGDIPIIGNLFRHTKENLGKVNLIVFLTPHIIRTDDDMVRSSRRSQERFRRHTRSASEALSGLEETRDPRGDYPDMLDSGKERGRPEYIFPQW